MKKSSTKGHSTAVRIIAILAVLAFLIGPLIGLVNYL